MRLAAAVLALPLATTLVCGQALADDRWMTVPKPPAMPEAASSGLAEVNGIKMYYATYGTDTGAHDPVLLIHGGLGNADIWALQVADLMKDRLVIVGDSRGHGRSTRTDEPYGYDLMSSDWLALMDYLKVDKVDLVGWSDGGIIGIDIAMHHPERLDKLFAQAANITVDGVDPGVGTNAVFGGYIDWMGEEYRRISPTPDQYDAFVAQISNMWATQPNWTDDQVKSITVPTAIVLGDHDEAITRAHTDRMAALIPGAEEIILKDASHFAMLQAPDEYIAAVRSFLSR
jgi:pimeloyl-ACP methyl ester carboxylesterase